MASTGRLGGIDIPVSDKRNGESLIRERLFFGKLPSEKIKINFNKNPIPMDLFLSFLTVEVERSTSHLGYCNGWTRLSGNDRLIIGGGVVGGVEYLDTIMYRTKLGNTYNNYVNPFFIFEIMTDIGKQFFLDYYAAEIQNELKDSVSRLSREKTYHDQLFEFWCEVGADVQLSE